MLPQSPLVPWMHSQPRSSVRKSWGPSLHRAGAVQLQTSEPCPPLICALPLRSFEAWPQALALQGRRAFVALRWGDGRSGRVAGLDLVTGCMLPGKLTTSSPGPLVVRP